MTKVFIAGSRKLSRLSSEVKARIDTGPNSHRVLHLLLLLEEGNVVIVVLLLLIVAIVAAAGCCR